MHEGIRLPFLILVMFFLLFVAVHPLSTKGHGDKSDSLFYVEYSRYIGDRGIGGFKDLLNWYASQEEHRFHPTPIRIGYILLGTFVFKILGPSCEALTFISTISFWAYLWISFWYCRKHFGREIALVFFLLSACSPFLLQMSRVALAESTVNMLWGAAVWMFLDFLKTPRSKTYRGIIGLVTCALLFKESSALLLLFFVFAWFLFRRSSSIRLSQILGLALWPLAIAGMVYVLVLGGDGLLTAGRSIYLTHFVDKANPYAIDFSSGPWFRYLVDFLLISPFVTIVFIGYSFVLLRNFKWEEAYFLFYYVFIFAILSIPQHSKVLRFVINLEMVMCLFTAFMLFKLFEEREYGSLIITVLLGGIVLYNINSFMHMIYLVGMLDPITYHLAAVRHLVPWR